MPADSLAPALGYMERQGASVGPERLQSLREFVAGLYEANEVQNLTRVPPEEFALRHLVDSLLVAEAAPPEGRWLDLGCGPGFPSWPLAWAYPTLSVTAMDGSERPLRFLRGHPLPNLVVEQRRAEEFDGRTFDVVTGRAFAPLAVQAEVSLPWVREGGAFVPFRTPADAEACLRLPAAALGAELERMVDVESPDGVVRLFPVFRKVAQSDRPRRTWAQIRARPLA